MAVLDLIYIGKVVSVQGESLEVKVTPTVSELVLNLGDL